MMKTILITISLFLITNAAYSASPIDLTETKSVNACLEKFGDQSSECLEDLNDKSEDAVSKVYNEKLQEMMKFDDARWWMGDENRKINMIDTFKKNQSSWLQYKETFCNTATTGAQGTHFLGARTTACNINMNTNRISDIRAIKMILSN